MTNPVSALHGQTESGRYGEPGDVGILLGEVKEFCIFQLAAWPETITAIGKVATTAANAAKVPKPGKMVKGKKADLLRVEPLKWWIVAEGRSTALVPAIDAKKGCGLDLSHSRAWVKINGAKAESMLNHFLPIDLRPESFPNDTVVTTAFHHTGVTLWRGDRGFNLLLPRSFSVSLWEQLHESALQYGLEVL